MKDTVRTKRGGIRMKTFKEYHRDSEKKRKSVMRRVFARLWGKPSKPTKRGAMW